MKCASKIVEKCVSQRNKIIIAKGKSADDKIMDLLKSAFGIEKEIKVKPSKKEKVQEK